ncbi:hypothetical protein EMIT0P43_30436 [Pseudomonas jessenii]
MEFALDESCSLLRELWDVQQPLILLMAYPLLIAFGFLTMLALLLPGCRCSLSFDTEHLR